MPFTSGSIAHHDAATEEFRYFGTDTNDSDYALLLTRLKDFLCGSISKPAPGGSNVGDGTIHSFDMVNPATAIDEDWTLTFSDDLNFEIVGDTYGSAGTFTLALGAERDFESVVANIPGATLTVTKGATAFAAADYYTFSTVRSPLTTQAYTVIADTARGLNSTVKTALEVMKYTRSTGEEAVFEQFGQYSQENSAPRFPVAISELIFYDQESLRETFYIDFYTATQYKLKDSAGGILASAALGDFVDYRSPALSIGLRVTKSGADLVYSNAAASSSGVPPTAKSPNTSGLGANPRTALRIKPPTNLLSTQTRVTRVTTLKATGLSGTDEMYMTFAQRVGGTANGNRYYLDCSMHRSYDPLLAVFEQVNISPPARIKNHQTATVDYNFIADGRSMKVLTKLTGGDYQTMAGGFFLPHSTPTSYPWPAFVLGTIGNGLFSPIPGDPPVNRKDESPGFCPGVDSLSPPVNGYDKSSTLWVCLPTSEWIHGANHAAAASSIGAANSTTQNLNLAAESFNAVYTAPWVYRDSGGSGDSGHNDGCRISPQAYGDATVKTFFPGFIELGSDLLSGILGEFPGIFFIGESSFNPVVQGDIIVEDGIDHLVWSGTTVQPQFSAVLAVFAKE